MFRACVHLTQCAVMLLQELGNRPGSFPREPARLVGEEISNMFDMEGGPVIMGGRVTEFLFARITGQGMTPLCAFLQSNSAPAMLKLCLFIDCV
jgi:hypothetical protein